MVRQLSEKTDARLERVQLSCIVAFCVIQLLFLLPETQELGAVVAARRYLAPLVGVVFFAASALRGFQGKGWAAAALSAFLLYIGMHSRLSRGSLPYAFSPVSVSAEMA